MLGGGARASVDDWRRPHHQSCLSTALTTQTLAKKHTTLLPIFPPANTAIMSDDEERVTMPFKFVTGTSSGFSLVQDSANIYCSWYASHCSSRAPPNLGATRARAAEVRTGHQCGSTNAPQALTPAFRTRTRPSTAGRTTSTTTSASTPRARTSSPAARYAPDHAPPYVSLRYTPTRERGLKDAF